MNTVVFSMMSPTRAGSIVASVRIAQFLAELCGVEVTFGEGPAPEKVDLLFVVLGPILTCKGPGRLEKLLVLAEHVVLVQNDYDVHAMPSWNGVARAVIDRGYSDRYDQKKSHPHFWTTIQKHAKKTDHSALVNWNALTYQESHARRAVSQHALFYYGAFRKNRVEAFNTWFRAPQIPVHVTTSSRVGVKKFTEYPVDIQPAMHDEELRAALLRYALGLYLEDKRSSKEYHSPANRFYEMLSAGLPMVFPATSREQLKAAGFDVRDFIYTPTQLKDALRDSEKIGAEQAARWRRPHREELTAKVRELMKLHFSMETLR